MRDKGEDLFRYKGVLSVKGMDENSYSKGYTCCSVGISVKK